MRTQTPTYGGYKLGPGEWRGVGERKEWSGRTPAMTWLEKIDRKGPGKKE